MTRPTIKPRESYAFAVCRNGGAMPRRRFATVDEAGEEAERQSAQRPGRTFIVMKEIARVSVKKPDPAGAFEAAPSAGGAGRLSLPSPGSNGSDRDE